MHKNVNHVFFLIIITLGYIFVLFYTANRNERKKPVIYPSNQKKDTRLSFFFYIIIFIIASKG